MKKRMKSSTAKITWPSSMLDITYLFSVCVVILSYKLRLHKIEKTEDFKVLLKLGYFYKSNTFYIIPLIYVYVVQYYKTFIG